MATEALLLLAKRGDQHVVSMLSACLKDQNSKIRQGAVEALEKLADHGDPQVIAALRDRLQDCREHVRCAAAKALMWLSDTCERGDVRAVSSMVHLERPSRSSPVGAFQERCLTNDTEIFEKVETNS